MADHTLPDPQAIAQTVAAAQAAEEQLVVDEQQNTAGEYDSLDHSSLVGTELEVDSAGDKDSTLGDELNSNATSVASSVLQGNWEHGRRYHSYKTGTYFIPNDDEEKDRLELQHKIWYIVLSGRLYLAPLNLDTLHNALDLGCGTGAWVMDFADAHPKCKIVGTDLSPIQPTAVPENAEFIVDDASSDWAFGKKFDYIHTRSITSGIKDWDRLLKQAFDHLNPGGWVELHELHMPIKCDDGTASPNSAIIKWSVEIYEASLKFGIDMLASLKHAERLREIGFTEVQETHIKWPIGPWPKGNKEKQIGAMFQQDIAGNLKGVSQKLFTQVLGQSQEEFEVFINQAQDDMYNPKIHTYFPVDIFWAQKPF
ncbi:S-adenosyl-L-methionine-dependent methyltransferase [Lophium mytilinum]|uniref:S-adenosyl-L-methionine-dependent methyltransferase n=1 Tax=Lophium mytilinum TaxID=390894 RepID=A0A6A6QPY0_9PEZI|nr:S-adenosyl-L-methionine-dependent methyltransferase [Lophium mytilinum]